MKLSTLFNPYALRFYIKQFIMLVKHGGRLHLNGYRLSLEPMAEFTIDPDSHIYLGRQIHLRKNADIEARDGAVVHIGNHFFMNKNSSIISRYGVTIGDHCMIGENTSIIDHNHAFHNPTDTIQTQEYTGSEITIGNNVWIAGRVFIGHGVHIGDNVVIGANTVVTKSIPSDSVVYGKTELIIKPLERRK
ncbi:MAG: acyltransferase [Sulfuricurvum sp.]|jgi:acetyltransferase-like isoleucine patch superfamily enzyme